MWKSKANDPTPKQKETKEKKKIKKLRATPIFPTRPPEVKQIPLPLKIQNPLAPLRHRKTVGD
jgi:hypothetical protein